MSDERRDRFEAIAAPAVEPLRRFLARRADAATADDVLADTLLVCWRRIDEVPDPSLPWLYGVARGCLANAQRGARRQRRVAARIAVVDPPTEAEVAGASSSPADDAVRAALTRIPDNDAELLRLWAWEQLEPAEIAVALGITPNAASIRLHRARGKLRAELTRKDGAGAGHEQGKGGRRGA